ncbi:MAG: hypothetical protein HY216_01300, partial [Candidatus Rokubacteria bacterium]|nr:hypothetical protein [Candidatus Rokubacteria bacterium]
MRKLIFAIALVVLNTPVWAQVSPYPDTAPTGNRQADAAKLSTAQAEY